MKTVEPSQRRRLSDKTTSGLLLIVVLLAWGSARAERLVTLDQAYALALKNHPTMALLRERVRQAEAARYRAWSALKPVATFSGTFTHYDQEIALEFPEITVDPTTGALSFGDSESIVIQEQNQFGFNAVARLPLFVGPAYPGIGVARKQVELARKTQMRSRQDFLLQVARGYYVVVKQKEVVRALQNKVTVNEKHLAAARARFQVGQSPRATVLRADLVNTQDQQQLRVQKNLLLAARKQLAILLGTAEAVAVKRPAEPPSSEGAGKEALEAALARRYDVQASALGVKLAQQGKEAIWWGFLPNLDLTWLYRWSETAGFAEERGSWNLMFTLNVPIYDGGIRYANLQESQAKVREAALQKRLLEQRVESEIVELRAQVDSANAGVISAGKAMELARTTSEDMEASFEAGVATQLDVLDANQRVLEAELQLTQSLFDRDLARLSLRHSLGQYDPVAGMD
jgi:outer membrane protein TolC